MYELNLVVHADGNLKGVYLTKLGVDVLHQFTSDMHLIPNEDMKTLIIKLDLETEFMNEHIGKCVYKQLIKLL